MKKTIILKSILFFLIFQFFYAFSAFAVDRIITEQDTCSPLVSFQVVPGSVTSWHAAENLPSGLTPANIKGMGVWDSYNRTITWGPFNDTVTRNLSYEITGNSASYTLTGTLTFDGTAEAITGDGQANIDCAVQLEQVGLPALDPASGATAPQSITLSSTTLNAEIRYTTDGSIPDSESDLFSAGTPIEIASKTHLRVRAFKHDMLDSDVVSALYPNPAPASPGTLVRSITNNNTCTPDIEIAVTPAAEVKTYAVQENVPVGLFPDNISDDGIFDSSLDLIKWGPFNDNSVRTLTYDYGTAGPDLDYSAVGTGSFNGADADISGDNGFTINCNVIPDRVAAPVFDPVTGSPVPVTLTLTCATVDAEIRYTTDGSLPVSGSTLYDANNKPVFNAAVNVRARAFKTGMLASESVKAGYIEPLYFPARSRAVTNNSSCEPLITLTVNPSAGVQTYCVEEVLPEELTPFNINQNGVFDSANHKLKWGPFNDSSGRTFSYNVQGVSGTYPVSGKISANGKSVAIDNDNEIIVTCTQVEAPIVSPYGNEPVPVTVSLTCPTADAAIYYTTNGSIPDLNSTLYSAPLDFISETTLKARAFKAGMTPSETITAFYPKAFSHADLVRSITDINDCSSSVSISMTPVEPFYSWAVEEYLPSGTMPQNINENGFWDNVAHKIKWGPFNDTSQRNLTYELIGTKGGHQLEGYASYDGTSEKISGDYTATIDCGAVLPKAAAPVFDQPSGTPVPLTIAVSSSTADAEIRYTTDGSLPDSGSALYTAPLNLTSRTSLRAMAFKAGMQESDVTSAFYPEPDAAALGTAQRAVSANDSCNPSASISVTPGNSVKSYGVEEKIIPGITVHNINENGVFDQALNTIKWGPFNDNTARTLTYDISGPNVAFSPEGIASFNGISVDLTGNSDFSIVCSSASDQIATPFFSPVSGTRVPVAVTLTCATPGAEIYYTSDGSIPEESSLLYSEPLQLNEAASLRAKAFAAGMTGSEPVSASYRAASLCAEEIEREILLDNTCYPLIRMRVIPVQGLSSWAVEENIPAGVTPSRINNSGVWDASLRKIKWGPFLNDTTRTFMYNLYGSDGTYSITGHVSINGKQENIAGLNQMQVLCVDADFDEDGIPDANDIGSGGGSCPAADDSDSDDDGLLDGLEDANQNGVVDPGETDPCNPDTDGDGVQDGTETGLTVDDLWGDTDLNVFQPDSDPSTTTDPTNPDSDGDGYYDGEEMRLGSDPNNNADTCVYIPGTYVLDNSAGNDLSGLGTSGSPWRTLHHAVHHLNGGTPGNYFIELGTGTYGVVQGEDAQSIIITQDNVTMTGSGIGNTVLTGVGGGLWENGLEISGNNILVQEMSIRNFATSGIEVTGSGTVINHCEISGNTVGILITATGNNAQVSGNCNIFQNRDFGILIDGCNDNLIMNNSASIYDNGIGISITAGSSDNLVQNNNIYWSGDPVNIQTIGILVSDAGTGNELIGNDIHDHSGTGYIGIKVENTTLDIFQNRMSDNETGIHLYSITAPASARIWNNLLYDSAGGMRDGIYLENQPGGTLVPQIFHNTIAGGSNDGINNNGAGADPLLSYNIITGFGQNGINNSGGLPLIDYNDVYNNSVSDYNGCTAGLNDISVDPGFVGGADYHLNLTSDCIDLIPASSGDPLTEDLDGNIRPAGSGYDIGCYEKPADTLNNPLPDTGQYQCYNDTEPIANPAQNEAFFGQDAQYIKQRSYTKLGLNGVELDDSATDWLMVKDNVTGLIWEVKHGGNSTADFDDPNDADNTYTWYDGSNGTQGDGVTTFDTEQFSTALNTAVYGGYSDWRMPTAKELTSITHWVNSADPMIDANYFPETATGGYWSSTTIGSFSAWYLQYTSSYLLNYTSKSSSYHVRAVRSTSTGLELYLVDNGDGTVTDPNTGLMWQQITPDPMDWSSASNYCQAQNTSAFAGYNNWRLPDIIELQSLVDYSRSNPAIYKDGDDNDLFSTINAQYWSSTTNFVWNDCAWVINFTNGLLQFTYGAAGKTGNLYLRLVRTIDYGSGTAGNITASPASIDFGETDSGSSSSPQTVTITNNGDADLVLGQLAISGTNATDFAVEQDCSHVTLTPGAATTLSVVFTPTALGDRNATLEIPSNDGDTPTFSVSLTGSGCADHLWYLDADGDGYGDPSHSTDTCLAPTGYVDNGDDCDDNDGLEHPGQKWYLDEDGDGYGDATDTSPIINCEQPSIQTGETHLRVANCADSDDSDAAVSAGFPLPDTGLDRCYDDTTEITNPAPGEDYYGQDGHFVRSRSYTRLSDNGIDDELDDEVSNPEIDINGNANWQMVRDNITGLIWEVKHNQDGTPVPGDPNDADNVYLGEDADINAFVAALNAANYGGHSDWRVPTIKELADLIDWRMPGTGSSQAFDPDFFPDDALGTYWSATKKHSFEDYYRWRLRSSSSFIDTGYLQDAYKYSLRAVRSGSTEARLELIDNGDGTITDPNTGLMWEQNAGGWASEDHPWRYCLDRAQYRNSINDLGYNDWRLPDAKELMSIIDFTKYPALVTKSNGDPLFLNPHSDRYWSSTTLGNSTSLAAMVNFSDGSISLSYIYGSILKSGQSLSTHLLLVRRIYPDNLAGDIAVDTDGDNQPETSPASIDFGEILLGNSSTPQTVTVSNNGDNELTLSELTITDGGSGDAADFAFEQDCSYSTLAPGTSTTLTVIFTPSAPGVTRNATLNIPSDDNDPAVFQVTLQGAEGTGCTPQTWYRDADGDGYGDPADTLSDCDQPIGYIADNTDCNDSNILEHPGQTWYKDADGDGYSDGTTNTTSCTRPAGFKVASELTAISGDCNDSVATINPGVAEICGDGVDNNCNGETDEGCCAEITFYRDIDGDGYGDAAVSLQACTAPADYVGNSSDCNDCDLNEHPGQIWYQDADGDGYSSGTMVVDSCVRPDGFYVASELATISGDSVDDDNSIYPGAPELYDGIDNNLNGTIDEECSSPGAVKLPDSGQNLYFNNWGPIATPAHGEPFFGQDAQYYHHRSYTKLGINGLELPDAASSWLMVRDNISGLIWEVKHNSDDAENFDNPNDADNRYTWYDSNPDTNGDKPGSPRETTDTEDFIKALNLSFYGGFNNWRLPTVSELSSLINRGLNSPAIDLEFFDPTKPSPYWSATPYSYSDENRAWHIYFGYGYVGSGLTSAKCYVRAVR